MPCRTLNHTTPCSYHNGHASYNLIGCEHQSLEICKLFQTFVYLKLITLQKFGQRQQPSTFVALILGGNNLYRHEVAEQRILQFSDIKKIILIFYPFDGFCTSLQKNIVTHSITLNLYMILCITVPYRFCCMFLSEIKNEDDFERILHY